MNILSINSGSASLKFKLFKMPSEELLLEGQFKNYDRQSYILEYRLIDGFSTIKSRKIEMSQWEGRVQILFETLEQEGLVHDLIVHRVVHGGEKYKKPVIVTEEVLRDLEKLSELAPLHNPAEISIIRSIHKKFPEAKQYACFDTSFFLSMPKEAYLYGLPYKYYEQFKIRRYGFHGISHKFVMNEYINVADGRDSRSAVPTMTASPKIIICHLGSGSSISAIKDGNPIDSSMGFSPTENLIMSTRVGEIDYDAVQYLQEKLKVTNYQIDRIMNEQSGLLGISGYTRDMKQLLVDYNNNEFAKLAIDMYVYLIVKQIAGFHVALAGADALIFTAGVGSGSDVIRKMICEKLKTIGVEISNEANNGKFDVETNLNITGTNSMIQVWVIPTNEELEMAKEISQLT